ncbi:MAG: DUF2190 family protein [Gallionellaceae bacterium]
MKTNKVILMVVAALAGLVCMGVASALGFDVTSSGVLGFAGVGMAANYVQEGDVLTLTAPYTVTSGQGAQIGSQFGVALADITNATAGEFATSGVWDLTALSTATGSQGAKAYWDNSNKRVDTDGTVGILIGSLTTTKTNGQTTARVKLNEAIGGESEGPQPAIVALTDSTSLSGTHDDTLAATAALVTLTDNTGGSGTHDDTLADGLTVGDALVDNSGGEAADGTIAVLVDAGGTAVGAPTTASVANALSELAARCNALRTDLVVQNQNDSDLAQKEIEIVAQLAVTNQNISDLAQKINEIRTALIAYGVIAAA